MKIRKEVTIYNVAPTLNISPSIISRGLKYYPQKTQETTDKIKAEANKPDFQWNRFDSNLRQRHPDTIGVIVPKLNINIILKT